MCKLDTHMHTRTQYSTCKETNTHGRAHTLHTHTTLTHAHTHTHTHTHTTYPSLTPHTYTPHTHTHHSHTAHTHTHTHTVTHIHTHSDTHITSILAGSFVCFRRSQILSCPLELADSSSVCSVHTRPVTVALSAFSEREGTHAH